MNRGPIFVSSAAPRPPRRSADSRYYMYGGPWNRYYSVSISVYGVVHTTRPPSVTLLTDSLLLLKKISHSLLQPLQHADRALQAACIAESLQAPKLHLTGVADPLTLNRHRRRSVYKHTRSVSCMTLYKYSRNAYT